MPNKTDRDADGSLLGFIVLISLVLLLVFWVVFRVLPDYFYGTDEETPVVKPWIESKHQNEN